MGYIGYTPGLSTVASDLSFDAGATDLVASDINSAVVEVDTALTDLENSRGVAEGLATLDINGSIPSTQLPSYVDDVLEVDTYADLPATGESGKIYIVIADETEASATITYRWSGTVYIKIADVLDAAELKTLYESNTDTNEFNDAAVAKLASTEVTSQLDARDVLNKDVNEHTEIGDGTDVNRLYVATDKVKVDHITITQNINMDTLLADTTASSAHSISDGTDHAYIDQDVTTTADVIFNTINGEDIVSMKTKLDTIQEGARDEQTPAEIEAAYEGILDTNKFTDDDEAKVGLISVTAAVDLDVLETTAELDARDVDNKNTDNHVDGATNGVYTLAERTKLGAIDQGLATTDEVVFSKVNGRQVYTDGEKLDLIEDMADVTDYDNVKVAGAVMFDSTSTSGMDFVTDEDTFVSDSSTKVPTQSSVKAYVDSKITSAKAYQGGYDPTTNTPDLTTANSDIKAGFVYDIIADGSFLGEEVESGDTLTAKQEAPTDIAHWIVTQSNITVTQLDDRDTANRNTDNHLGGTINDVFTLTDRTKLASIEEYSEKNVVTSVSGRVGDIVLAKEDVGLNQVDNTNDLDKPISDATNTELDLKATKSQTSSTDTVYADAATGLTYKMYMLDGSLVMEEL